MTNKKKVLSEKTGKVTYKQGVVHSIISLAVREIAGVASLNAGVSWFKRTFSKKYFKGIRIEFNQNKAYLDVFLNVYFGYSMNELAYKVQENVKKSVESMTEFKVEMINVHVPNVVFDKEQEDISITL